MIHLGRVLAIVAAVATVGAVLYYTSEARRYAARIDYLATHNRELEQQLAAALAEREQIHQLLADKVAEFEAAREQDAELALERRKAMPEGVRLTLVALNDCLREDGFSEIRFLRATALTERTLYRVEMVESDRRNLFSSLYIAGRVTVRLDRDLGVIGLRFSDGYKLTNGVREPFPEAGCVLRLEHVAGPMWEGRLGHLIEAAGAYPVEQPEIPRASLLTRDQRASWIDRFERLLGDAGSHVRYRVDSLAGLEAGVFTGIVLLGYDEHRNLAAAIEAARLQVVCTERHHTVELLLEDGVLRKDGGEATISADGYRILLPNVTRERAMGIMLGMVSDR